MGRGKPAREIQILSRPKRRSSRLQPPRQPRRRRLRRPLLSMFSKISNNKISYPLKIIIPLFRITTRCRTASRFSTLPKKATPIFPTRFNTCNIKYNNINRHNNNNKGFPYNICHYHILFNISIKQKARIYMYIYTKYFSVCLTYQFFS